ncbi:MAG: hypothetical protein RL612_411, partial [Actinomycetota bacterium]
AQKTKYSILDKKLALARAKFIEKYMRSIKVVAKITTAAINKASDSSANARNAQITVIGIPR